MRDNQLLNNQNSNFLLDDDGKLITIDSLGDRLISANENILLFKIYSACLLVMGGIMSGLGVATLPSQKNSGASTLILSGLSIMALGMGCLYGMKKKNTESEKLMATIRHFQEQGLFHPRRSKDRNNLVQILSVPTKTVTLSNV